MYQSVTARHLQHASDQLLVGQDHKVGHVQPFSGGALAYLMLQNEWSLATTRRWHCLLLLTPYMCHKGDLSHRPVPSQGPNCTSKHVEEEGYPARVYKGWRQQLPPLPRFNDQLATLQVTTCMLQNAAYLLWYCCPSAANWLNWAPP